jgi:thiamine-monophosphate kinase
MSHEGSGTYEEESVIRGKVMKLKDIGEHELIQRFFKTFSVDPGSEINRYPHDDCAVIDFDDKYLLLTTDIINERTHIPEGASGYQVGWFLMAINLSDLAAKGAVPLGFLNSLALPSELEYEFIEDFGKGILSCGQMYNCPVIGGDTKSSPELTLAGTAVGTVKKDHYMPRKGCQGGDVLAVTGQLGPVRYAFHKLKTIEGPTQDNPLREIVLKLILEVKPQLWAGQMLAKLGCCGSAMDLSDGLGSSLHQLAELNEVGFSVEFEKIPQVPLLSEMEPALSDSELEEIMLYAGGDYELLVAMNPAFFETAKSALEQLGSSLTIIGDVHLEDDIIIKKEGVEEKLENRSFDHFKDE